MVKVLIVYYSRTNHIKKMAQFVEEGAKEEKIDVICKTVDTLEPNELLESDGIIIGSPTYFGSMSYPVKKMIDDSIIHYGKLDGKVGGAFTSCQRVGGGGETTLQSIINAYLVHGMIIQGGSKSSHYGPLAIGSPDDIVCEECRMLGKKIAQLAKKIHSNC